MPANIRKEDLRITKTEKALNGAMSALLRRRNFGKITVSNICEEALISRATFYAHFTDKYELLRYWLIHFRPEFISEDDAYEQIEKTVNQFIHQNGMVIKNLVYAADNETLEILCDALLSILNLTPEKNNGGNPNLKYIVLSNFYAGGAITYLSWQIRHKFPSDVPPINTHLFDVIRKIRELASD